MAECVRRKDGGSMIRLWPGGRREQLVVGL